MSERLATVHELRPIKQPDMKEINAGLVHYELQKHKEAIQNATTRQEEIAKEFSAQEEVA